MYLLSKSYYDVRKKQEMASNSGYSSVVLPVFELSSNCCNQYGLVPKERYMFTVCRHCSYWFLQPICYVYTEQCHGGIAGSIKSISSKLRNLGKFLSDNREHVLFLCMLGSFGCSPHQQTRRYQKYQHLVTDTQGEVEQYMHSIHYVYDGNTLKVDTWWDFT